MEEKVKDLTPLYGRLFVRLVSPFPNFDVSFMKPVRREAVRQLSLRAGDRVLDLGCGPGGSLPFLVQAVGPLGRVVGVEISPALGELAKRRIEKNQWKNVEVILDSAQDVVLEGTFDGLLMFAAPDVYASGEALANIVPHLKDDARIAAFGAKLSTARFGRIFNPVLKMLYRLSFLTTPRPDHEPWRILSTYMKGVAINEYFFGLMFLASGTLAKKE